ncbi:ABC transporter permease [Persicobacter psychrovividus]|uniref:ABC transporter permease n=1 Tax=Persicobacter psychrovividus TaxID=387638 RepID=A0ABN6LJB7_9BACT|nr:ABC transporter permease [Persicobacter psychrovividus]
METFIALIKREFRMMFSNSVVMAIFFAAPVVYGLLFGFTYQKGSPSNLPIMVVDLDQSALSSKIVDMLDDNELITVDMVKYDKTDLPKTIRSEKYKAVITIPHHFEADILQKRDPELSVAINTANIVSANYSAKGVQYVMKTLQAGIEIEGLKKQGIPEEIARHQYEPFSVNYERYYNETANYMRFLWPGMIGTIIQQVFLLALALTFAREFEEGKWHEITSKTKKGWKIMGIKILPFLLTGVMMLAAVGVMFPMFNIPLAENMPAMAVLLFAFLLPVIFLGILLSLLVPNQLKATEIAMVLATPSFVVSGFTWPLSQMPDAVAFIGRCIPLTHFLAAFRELSFYGAGLSDIIPQLKVLALMTVIFGLLSMVLLYFKLRKIPTNDAEQAKELEMNISK